MHKIREQLILKLCRTFNNEEIEFILNQVDAVLMDYDLKEKNRYPVVSANSDILLRFFEAKRIGGMSIESIKVYKSELKDYVSFVGVPIILATSQNIMDYFVGLRKRRNISDRSLEHRRIVINSLYTWLYENEYIQKNPCLKIQKIKFRKNVRLPLTSKELEQIRYACRNSIRESAILEFLYSTGCRVSELCRVKISDIDFYNKEVKVLGKGNKERIVYLNVIAENAIRRYLDTRKVDTDWLFTQKKNRGNAPLDTDSVRYAMKEIERISKLERSLSPHIIRHTTATDLIKKGMPVEDVQYYLGHTKIDTTMDYIKMDRRRVKANFEKCFA